MIKAVVPMCLSWVIWSQLNSSDPPETLWGRDPTAQTTFRGGLVHMWLQSLSSMYTHVLGHTEEPPTQLKSSSKQEEASITGGSKHNVTRLPYKLGDLKWLREEKLYKWLQLMAMTNSKSRKPSWKFSFKCNIWSYFSPRKKSVSLLRY